MKILQVINSLNTGGAEMLLLEYTPLLKDRNIDVSILTLEKTELNLKISMESKGVKMYSLNSSNIYNPFISIYLLKYIYKYDIVHVHLFPSQYWVAIAKIMSFSKVKLVTTEHNTTNRRREIFYFRYIDKIIYSIYSKIITISNKATVNLITYLQIESHIVTIHNGINISKFRNSSVGDREKIVHLDSSITIVIMVAGFREQKDQATLIKAISLLPSSFHLILVGDGVLKQKCQKLAIALNMEPRVHFLGIRDDIPQLLKMSDIVVLSSHFEGLSLSSIEGMSVGRPFVATDVDGLHEVVDGAGLLFQEGNEKQLANILYDLSIDDIKSAAVAHSCYLRAEKYNINVMVDKYITLYDTL